jgi:hypothetical protein
MRERSGMTPEQIPPHRIASLIVDTETSGWTRLTKPGFLVEFSYPDPTPDGQAVIRDEQSFREYARVHLSSPDRRELYLEVVRFHDLAPEDEYRQHKPYLELRFGADAISSLTATRVREWPAAAYSFGWTEQGQPVERSVLLVEVEGETYRIIFDPRSELNARVIATLIRAP